MRGQVWATHFAVHAIRWFLWRKKPNDTYLHNHEPDVSTWSHVGLVQGKALLTTQRALKTVANPKSNRIQLQSCGNSKTENATQRTETVLPFK